MYRQDPGQISVDSDAWMPMFALSVIILVISKCEFHCVKHNCFEIPSWLSSYEPPISVPCVWKLDLNTGFQYCIDHNRLYVYIYTKISLSDLMWCIWMTFSQNILSKWFCDFFENLIYSPYLPPAKAIEIHVLELFKLIYMKIQEIDEPILYVMLNIDAYI